MKKRKEQTERRPLRVVFRVVDHIVFAAICAAAIRIPLRADDRVTLACAFVMFAVFTALIWIDRRTDRKKAACRLKETAEAIRIEKLLLKTDAEIRAALHEPGLVFIRRTDAGESDMLEAIRAGARCILVVRNAERFRLLIATHAPQTRLMEARDQLEALGVVCTEREAQARLKAAQKPRAKRLRLRSMGGGGAIRFFALGILLLVLSLAWKHKIYYRLLSAACFAASYLAGRFDLQNHHFIFGNHLDNIDK